MKHSTRYIALSLTVALACLAVLTACSGDKSESVSQAPSTAPSSSQAASGSTEPAAEQTTVMGEVTYVGSDYISVTTYTGGEDVTDYTALDVAGLTATDETVSIDTNETTEYFRVESGMLNAASREDVTTGAFIVSDFDEEGKQQIILIQSSVVADDSAAVDESTASASDGQEGAEEASPDASDASETAGESAAAEA